MTPREQQIAMARMRGWKFCANLDEWLASKWPATYLNKKDVWVGLPSYFSDLNAMHQVEEEFSIPLRREFAHELELICLCRDRDAYKPIYEHDLDEDFFVAHAKASQRLEAALRVLKLWKE